MKYEMLVGWYVDVVRFSMIINNSLPKTFRMVGCFLHFTKFLLMMSYHCKKDGNNDPHFRQGS